MNWFPPEVPLPASVERVPVSDFGVCWEDVGAFGEGSADFPSLRFQCFVFVVIFRLQS